MIGAIYALCFIAIGAAICFAIPFSLVLAYGALIILIDRLRRHSK